MRFSVSPVTAAVACSAMAAAYVGVLYTLPRSIRRLPRDHPTHVRVAIALGCCRRRLLPLTPPRRPRCCCCCCYCCSPQILARFLLICIFCAMCPFLLAIFYDHVRATGWLAGWIDR